MKDEKRGRALFWISRVQSSGYVEVHQAFDDDLNEMQGQATNPNVDT